MLRRLGAALVAVPLLLAGCADDGDSDGGDENGAAVEFRRVVTSSPLAGGCHATGMACDAWARFSCPGEPEHLDGDLLMACGADDKADRPFLLGPAEIVGGVESAEAVDRERIDQWEVELRLEPGAAEEFAALTAELVPDSAQLAIVLDEEVVSAPAVQTEVTDGVIRLAGDYTEDDAERLADELDP